jgi:hypothetical protein
MGEWIWGVNSTPPLHIFCLPPDRLRSSCQVVLDPAGATRPAGRGSKGGTPFVTLTAKIPTMKKSLPLLTLFVFLLSASFAQQASTTDDFEVPEYTDEPVAVNTDALQKQSNKLWLAYNKWTYKVMRCLNDEDPSDLSIRRLLKHEDAVDDALEYFYGDSIETKLSELLYRHKSIIAEMRRTALAGDVEANEEACKQLRINKKEVIEFIRRANPLFTVAQVAEER